VRSAGASKPTVTGPDGYESLEHTDRTGRTHGFHRRGSGPPIIVLHELGGISPTLVTLADKIIQRGFTVYLPSLVELSLPPGRLRLLEATLRICVSAEFAKLARNKTSPVVHWLRSLSAEINVKSGHRVGVVGLCLTGGFALAMAVEPHVAGPVVAHPSLPIGIGSRRRRDLGLDPADLTKVKARTDIRFFGVRMSEDLVAPCPRFDRMEEEFGDRFIRTDVPSGRKSQHGISRWEHPVLTSRLLDPAMNHPARPELERILSEALDFLEAEVRVAAT